MRVRILESDERLGVKAGEIYHAVPYWLDPPTKVTLLGREPDGYDPSCNQYRCEVEVLTDAGPRLLSCDCGCAPVAEREAKRS